jgi:hypothetical protein
LASRRLPPLLALEVSCPQAHEGPHLSLGKDAPEGRAVQPPRMGNVVELPEVGGLHHRYERRAA